MIGGGKSARAKRRAEYHHQKDQRASKLAAERMKKLQGRCAELVDFHKVVEESLPVSNEMSLRNLAKFIIKVKMVRIVSCFRK
jgi:hypothetical protein